MKKKTTKKPSNNIDRVLPLPVPEIVRVATSIANTERALVENAGKLLALKVKLDEHIAWENATKKVLVGLQREMDRHTAGVRVH